MTAPQSGEEPTRPHPAWVGFFAEVLRLDAELTNRLASPQIDHAGINSLPLAVAGDVLLPKPGPALPPETEPTIWGSQAGTSSFPVLSRTGQGKVKRLTLSAHSPQRYKRTG